MDGFICGARARSLTLDLYSMSKMAAADRFPNGSSGAIRPRRRIRRAFSAFGGGQPIESARKSARSHAKSGPSDLGARAHVEVSLSLWGGSLGSDEASERKSSGGRAELR